MKKSLKGCSVIRKQQIPNDSVENTLTIYCKNEVDILL